MEKTIKYTTKFYYCPADQGFTPYKCPGKNGDCFNIKTMKLLTKKEKSWCNKIAMLKKCGGKNGKRHR